VSSEKVIQKYDPRKIQIIFMFGVIYNLTRPVLSHTNK
jgi:hypothetical protein